MEFIVILGIKLKIIFNEFCVLFIGVGIKCNDICMIIIIIKVEEKLSYIVFLVILWL